MEETIQKIDFKRYMKLIYRRRYLFVISALVFVTMALAISNLIPVMYEAHSTVFIEKNFLNVLIKDVAITPSFDDRLNALSETMKSRTLLLKVIDKLKLADSEKFQGKTDLLIKKFQDNTRIKEASRDKREMDFFKVSYSDEDPKLARDYVNALIKEYIEENLSSRKSEAYGASRFIAEQIRLLRDKIARTENEITNLRTVKGITASHEEQNAKLLLLQKKLDELIIQYTYDHPDVVKVRNEIEVLKSAKKGNLEDAPALNKRLSDLEMEREKYKKTYEDFVLKLSKSEVSTQIEAQDKANIFKIIDPALLAEPITSKGKFMIIGIFISLAVGLSLVFLVDFMDKSVRTADALRKFDVPVLAIIPVITTKKEIAKKRKLDFLFYSVVSVYVVGLLVFSAKLLK